MDERTLRKLAAAAEHERQQATVLAEAVACIEAKVERAEADLAGARASLVETQADADAAEDRALQAEAAYRQAADGAPIAVRAGLAAGSGEVR